MRLIATSLLISLLLGCGHATTYKINGMLSTQALNQAQSRDFVIIYVHGFGEGAKDSIPFPRALNEFIEDENLNVSTIIYQWDKQSIDFLNINSHWDNVRERADHSGEDFYRKIIAPLESSGVKYYIIGYSLGTRVIANMLSQTGSILSHMQGLTFVGSAIESDKQVELKPLPSGLVIKNYHSPHFDYALKTSFFIAEGKEAAGEVGFSDHSRIKNYRTVCSHAYKGGPLQRDYSSLASTFIEMFLFEQGIQSSSQGINFNMELQVLDGDFHWSDVLNIPRGQSRILIQRNANTGWFRAVQVDKDQTRTRKAWSYDLRALLNAYNG